MEWKTVKLGDIADVKGGKRLPKGVSLISQPNKHPYIRIRDIGASKYLELTQDYEYVDDVTQQSIKRYIVNTNDILLSIVGTIGLVGVVGETLNYANQTENCVKINNLHGIDRDYLYYYLVSSLGQQEIKLGTVGAVQAKLPLKNVQSISIPLPSLDDQRRIAAILSSLDDKIENNNRINRNLEAQAQALFKSWFVDFEPFGGTMPNDWKEGTLGDIVTVKRGGSPRPIQDYLSDKGYRWLKISDATAEASPFISHIVEHIKEEGLNKTVFIKQGSLVLSNSATPGLPKFVDLDTCIHDGWLYFSQSYFSNEYLYLLFQRERLYLLSQGNGSVFTNLKTEIVKNLSVTIPSKDVLNNFQKIIGRVFEEILNNQRENVRLAALRDTLLPKLMKGEIEI